MKTAAVILIAAALLGGVMLNAKNASGDNGLTYLAPALKNLKFRNKYLFIDNYVPSVMKQKGKDYIDAYKATAPVKDNYFFFENEAIERKQNSGYVNSSNFFRCLYINDAGQISHVIKRKIIVKELDSPERQPQSAREYGGKAITPEELTLKITSSEEFTYIYFEKNVVREVTISNDSSSDLIYNSRGERIYEKTSFYRAEFVYDSNGKFIDLKNME